MRSLAILLAGGGAMALAFPALADVKAGVDSWSRGDFAGAILAWQGPAAKGDADAQFNLAQAYKMGRGVIADPRKAEELYRKAAAQGHLQASDNYGLMLFQNGRQQDALPWLAASAARGEPRAQYILAIANFNGDYVGKDWVRAYALMTRAAAGGMEAATAGLATMDTMIPLEQRQMGVALAADVAKQAEETRAQQIAAADLGVKTPPRSPIRAISAPAPVTMTPVPPSTGTPVTAGADYANPVTLSAPKPAPAKTAPSRPAAAPRATGNWRVQLGAFGQRKNADALWNRVKAWPELAGHARIDLPAGPVTRLQAGGFAGEADATSTCAALRGAGMTCLVVRP